MRLGDSETGDYRNDYEEGIGASCEDAMEQPMVLVGGAISLVIFTAIAIMSLGAVPPLTYGIKYNAFSKAADTITVYPCGRYFIGPWNSFLLFPASVQTIEFTSNPRLLSSGVRYEPLHTRTREGLALHLQVSLQYELRQKEVGSLYHEFNLNYEQTFISTIRDVLIKAAAQYEANQLWEERNLVGRKMQHMVDIALNDTYASCWGLQLMVIELPKLFEDSIVRTQVQKQAMATRKNEQAAKQIRAMTSVIKAEYDKQVKVITAHGKANYSLQTKSADAHARQRTIDIEARTMQRIGSNLTMNGDQLVTYQKYNAYQLMPDAELFYGFGNGANVNVMVGSGGGNLPSQTSAPTPVILPGGGGAPKRSLMSIDSELATGPERGWRSRIDVFEAEREAMAAVGLEL